MLPSVHVHMLPDLIVPGSLAGGVAVVIDVLRASTTIIHALASGAARVLPCETVDAALEVAGADDRRELLLGGERNGQLIEGFDLDNSPFSYTSGAVAGKVIAFTTTNGTRALWACETASRVLIGAFVNRAALVRVLLEDGRPVHLVCAGTEGRLTAEDILFAGAVASDLTRVPPPAAAPMSPPTPRHLVSQCGTRDTGCLRPDVQTQMAIDYYHARSVDEATFLETIRTSRGGQNLLHLGLHADIARAAQCDLFDLVPEWHPAENRIVPAPLPVI